VKALPRGWRKHANSGAARTGPPGAGQDVGMEELFPSPDQALEPGVAAANPSRPGPDSPLAARLRPAEWQEVLGQSSLIGPAGALRDATLGGNLPSMVLVGAPGTGKTTIAQLLARSQSAHLVSTFDDAVRLGHLLGPAPEHGHGCGDKTAVLRRRLLREGPAGVDPSRHGSPAVGHGRDRLAPAESHREADQGDRKDSASGAPGPRHRPSNARPAKLVALTRWRWLSEGSKHWSSRLTPPARR